MGWFVDGHDYGTYDPYADRDDYNSSSPDLDKYMPKSAVEQARQKMKYAKQDYDMMNQVGDYDEEVISNYNKATEEYKKAVMEADPEELLGEAAPKQDGFLAGIFGQKSRVIPARKKEPIICNNIEVTERPFNADSFVQIVTSPLGR